MSGPPPGHAPGTGTGDGADGRAEVTIDAVVPGARSVARAVVRPTLQAWLRLRVEHEDHVPRTGPVLIASTHASHADSMALGAALKRPVFFLGDERLEEWPVLGPMLPKLGMVGVKRGQGDTSALDKIRTLLVRGEAVVVYPEGSRSRDGRIYRPRSGVSRLAAELQVPVVPAAVVGSYAVWPTGRKPRPLGGPVRIRFGECIAPPEPTPASRRRFNRHLHKVLAVLADAEAADEFAPVGGPDGTDPGPDAAGWY